MKLPRGAGKPADKHQRAAQWRQLSVGRYLFSIALSLDGLGLLVNQGAIAVKLWTGVEANRGVMRWALERVLGLG